MNAEQIADLLFRDPFVPVKVSPSDGGDFVIAQPHRAHITKDELIVGVAKDPLRRQKSGDYDSFPWVECKALKT